MGENRENPAVIVWGEQELDLREDVRDVRLDCLRGEEQSVADGLVRATLRHEGEDLALALRQVIGRLDEAPRVAGCDLRPPAVTTGASARLVGTSRVSDGWLVLGPTNR